jgi:RNA-binding protein YhbY
MRRRGWIVFVFLFLCSVGQSFPLLNKAILVYSTVQPKRMRRFASIEVNGDKSSDSTSAGQEQKSAASPSTNNMERAWRYARKPLLSIGAQGAKLSHGNSLRQLLDAHTVVKVKVNTQTTSSNLETAFEILRDLAVESGASPDLECLQCRKSERILFIGLPGTRQRIEQGDFPPPSSV